MCKGRNNVPKDQRIVILSGLIAHHPRVGAIRGIETVFSNVGNPGCFAEEESLNGNDVNGVDRRVAIDVSGR